MNRHMDADHSRCLVFAFFLGLIFTCVSVADAAWYQGCFVLPNIDSSEMRFHQAPLDTPAKCAKECLGKTRFAFLHSGSDCLCQNSLTRQVHDSACSRPCSGDSHLKCGDGRRFGSVYTTHGPYVASIQVLVQPVLLLKNKPAKITVKVELASDTRTHIGIKRLDRMSFGHVSTTIRLSSSVKPYMISIRGRKGELSFMHAFVTEGEKYIAVTVENEISSFTIVRRVPVTSKVPQSVTIQPATGLGSAIQPACAPDMSNMQSLESVVFTGESPLFTAIVEHGFNLTFAWDFCGLEIRNISVDPNIPNCKSIQCSNIQDFTFTQPGTCKVRVRVYNDHGSVESVLNVSVIVPDLRDLEVTALPQENTLRPDDSLAMYDAPGYGPSWEFPNGWNQGSVEEGQTFDSRDLGRGGMLSTVPSTNYQTSNVNLFPFLTPQVNPDGVVDGNEEDNHIPLPDGKYLMNAKITFKVSAYMTSMPGSANVEIDFGDGETINQTLSKERSLFGLSESRMKRHATEMVTPVKRRFQKAFSPSNHHLLRQKRSVAPLYPYSLNGPNDPYAPDLEFQSRSGLIQLGNNYGFHQQSSEQKPVQITYGEDCLLLLTFQHEYKKPGRYNVVVKVFNGTHSKSATINPSLSILDGTPDLNIRCPEAIEIGKSVILSASSTKTLPNILNWKILRRSNSGERWISVVDKKTSRSSFKKSFLVRGNYKVELVAPAKGFATSCRLQVEEPLSGLTVNVPKTFVEIGDNFEVSISLESGSAADIKVHFGNIVKDAVVRKSRWTARFRVLQPRCHDVFIVAKNPVSNLTSRSVRVCGEEPISGFSISVQDYGETNSRVPMTFTFGRGTNVTLQVQVISLAGRTIASYNKAVPNPAEGGVEILTPKITDPGIYKVVGQAHNHVAAKTETCDVLSELTSKAQFVITRLFKTDAQISLIKRPILRGKDNQDGGNRRDFNFMAKLNDQLLDEVDVLYLWTLQNVSGDLQREANKIVERWTSSPLFAIALPHCDVFTFSPGDATKVLTLNESADSQLHKWPKCRVSVKIITRYKNVSTSQVIYDGSETPSQSLIRPQTNVIQSGKSGEFDIKCPPDESDMCQVSFADGTEPMKIPSNANWNSLSHAFTKPGLYEVTLTSSTGPPGASHVLNTTSIIVMEHITSVKIEGTRLVEHEETARGSWRVSAKSGTHKIYHWSIYFKNRTKIHDEYNREVEWEFLFQDDDEYIVRVTVYNEISKDSDEMMIVVQQIPLHFVVEAENSILGKASTFIVETNATVNIVAVRFEMGGPITEFDLSCMKPNSTKINKEDKRVKRYVITHKYNRTGSYQATFMLLSHEDSKTSKHLYTLKTEVLHQPAPEQITLKIISPNAVENDQKYFVPSGKKVIVRVMTNYPTNIFNWIVKKRREKITEIGDPSPSQATNSSTAKYTFIAERHTSYNISVVSFPKRLQSKLYIEAEDVISKVWMDEPFSEDKGFVSYCRLRRYRVNNTLIQSCDELTLTAFSDGTHVTYHFYIRFRPEVEGDYSAPTKVVDIIPVQATPDIQEAVNEVSIKYSFTEQGVYHISVVASNNLGNKSAEIPVEQPSYGAPKPFLLHAQRPVPQIHLTEEDYYVELNKLMTFEIKPLNSLQVVEIQWRMGDGTIKSGPKVQHTYTMRGLKLLRVTAKNLLNEKTTTADVKVEIPIHSVKLAEVQRVYSTREAILLQAEVQPPGAAWNYTWYLTNDNNVTPVIDQSYIEHYFDTSNIYLVKVLAANGINAVESLPIEIEVQEPINAELNCDSVVLRNEEIEMSVTLNKGSEVSIEWSIDGGHVLSKNYNLKHIFTEIGTHTIDVKLKNKLGTFPIRKNIFVDDHPCMIARVNIVKGNGIEIWRSKRLRLEAEVDMECSFIAKVNYHWEIREYVCPHIYVGWYEDVEYDPLPNIDDRNRILELPPRTLEYGCYNISVNVTLDDSIQFKVTSLRAQVFPSPLVPLIDGGTVHTISRDSEVTIDASLTYDPDYPANKDGFIFEWKCFILNSPQKSCFKEEEMTEEGEIPTTSNSPMQPPVTSAMRAAEDYHNQPDTNQEDIYKKFPSAVSSNSSVIMFPASLLVSTAEVFIFKVEIVKDGRVANTTVVLKEESGTMEWVKVNCSNCRGGAVPRNIPLMFNAECVTCTHEDGRWQDITYTWTIHEIDGRVYSESFLENDTRDCAPPDGSGWMSLVGRTDGSGNDNDTDLEESVTYEISNETYLHPADSNFTGILPPLNEPAPVVRQQRLEQPQNRPLPEDDTLSEGMSNDRRTEMENTVEGDDSSQMPEQNSGNQYQEIPPFPTPPDLSSEEGVDVEMAPRGAQTREVPDSYDEYHQHPEPTTSTRDTSRHGRYGGSRHASPGTPSQESHTDVEEGLTGMARNLGSLLPGRDPWNDYYLGYRSGQINPHGDGSAAPYFPGGGVVIPDSYRNDAPKYDTPSAKHYQDMKRTELNLETLSLNGVSKESIILRPNSLTEGKTYAVTVDVQSQRDDKNTSGRSSFYFSILRGPGFGMCTVLPRKSTKNFKVYCMQWRNQQNGENDRIRLKEMLRYEISYSMEKDGPKRHIYSGVSNERYFDLPASVKPEFIHIALRNSDGASTNVCSFPQNVTPANETLSVAESLEKAYGQAVGSDQQMPKLSLTVQKGDKEEIISLVNVILDTLPTAEELQKLKNLETKPYKKARKIFSSVIRALNSVGPSRMNEVIYVLDTLTRALSNEKLVTASALFEASELLINTVSTLEIIKDSESAEQRVNSIFTDVRIMELLVLSRYYMSKSCKKCAGRIIANPRSEEVNEALLRQNVTKLRYGGNNNDIMTMLIKIEGKVYGKLNRFFVGLSMCRPIVLGELRSQVDGYGVVVQRFKKAIDVFEDDEVIFGNNSGQWKVGAIFPDKMIESNSSKSSDAIQIASTLPDLTLANFEKHFIENRPLFLGVYKNTREKMLIRNLKTPIIIALPPRKSDGNILKGVVARDRVAYNSFSVFRRPNRTLHVEVILATNQKRSFPVTIAITDEKTSEHVGVVNPASIITMKRISRMQFQNYNDLNSSIAVKFTLKDTDFKRDFANYFVSLWNEQAMTSRSRHYDISVIPYTLRIWWSDCFYWDGFVGDWKHDGLDVLDVSTSTQTLCSTNHLSSFSGSYLAVKANAHTSDIGVPIGHTALRGSIAILVIIIAVMSAFTFVHYRILRPRDVETPASSFRNDYYGSRPRYCEIGRRLRWFFGPDHKANSVPIALHDNRTKHKQVYEVKIQTSCWPGSGTTSNVSIILYGEEGKYGARELLTPKTHNAREARYENGYSENDDYTGVDDELFITGSTQTFIITFPEHLGPLWKMTLWHDHSGECPRWKLDYATVRDVSSGEKWHFPCYGWLGLDRGARSLSTDLRPVYYPPSLYMQVALKFQACLLNFSSICSLVASPGYSKLTRSQRAVHLFALVVTICGLTTMRYMLGWDIYSHDTDLPYIHSVSVSWGLIIGLIASIIILPAQLLLRFSKHDERISVTIEDATGSLNGIDFPDDYGSFQHSSSADVRLKQDYHDHPECKTPLKEFSADKIPDCAYTLPSVEDVVYDWLELKAWSETRPDGSPDKDLPLPEVRSVSSHNWRQSTNSLDEEIVRCMMSSSPVRKSREIVRDGSTSPVHKNSNKLGEEKQKAFLTAPTSYCGSIASPLAYHRDGISGLKIHPYDTDDAKNIALAMDGPELVPCEKLEPIPQEKNAPLPRGCRKLAWCYYAIITVGACVLTLCGSVTMIRLYDVEPWIECIVLSIMSAVVIIEGSLILLASLLSASFGLVRWYLSDDELSTLLDNVFSSANMVVVQHSVDPCIESTTYQSGSSREYLSANNEIQVEDARVAREIADRERSRYLRHVKPASAPPGIKRKLVAERRISKATGEWMSVVLLLTLGVVVASVISSGYNVANYQSRDVEAWFEGAESPPETGGYVFADPLQDTQQSKFVYANVRSRNDWLKWFQTMLPECPKTQREREKMKMEQSYSITDYLLRDKEKFRYLPKGAGQYTRYILIGAPTLAIEKSKKFKDSASIPEKVLNVLNYTLTPDRPPVPKMNAMLSGKGHPTPNEPSEDDVIVYKIPSRISKDKEMAKRLKYLLDMIKNQPAVSSVTVDIILQNPYTNLYSQISARTEFYNEAGFHNFGQVSGRSMVAVSSVAISQRGVDRYMADSSMNVYYLCQMVLLIWSSYKFMRALVAVTRCIMLRFTNSVCYPNDTKCNPCIARSPLVIFDVFTWILAVICLVYSGYQRSYIESIMPSIYGYENADAEIGDAFSLNEVTNCSTRLATAFGLFNFVLIIKLLYVAKYFHGLPKIPLFSKKKYAITEIFLVLFLFWALAFLLAFIGFLLFANDVSFSSYLRSVMVIVLSSVTLGLLPANMSVDMATMRAKYGVLATTWFFLTVFITFRLILKGLLIATYKKDKERKDDEEKDKDTKRKSKNDSSQSKGDEQKRDPLVKIVDLLKYNAQKFKFFAICLSCIILRKDPSMRGLNDDSEFSSLGFSKSKQVMEREKKKLGPCESFGRQASPASSKVVESKLQESRLQSTPTKYNLPSEVWLLEVETQLEELYSRASALADAAYDEIPLEALARIFLESRKSERDQSGIKSPSKVSCNSASSTNSGKSDAEVFQEKTHNEKKYVQRKRSGSTEGKPPIRRVMEQRGRRAQKIAPVRVRRGSNEGQNKLPPPGDSALRSNPTTRSRQSHGRRGSTPSRTISKIPEESETPASPPVPKKIHAKPLQSTSATRLHDAEGRRFGWVSDVDVDNSSDISRAASSFGGRTPVPPLTAHNLARHNYNILSRTSSSSRGGSGSEPNAGSAEQADMPSTSKAVFGEEMPEPINTISGKLWKTLSSFKKAVGQVDVQNKAAASGRALRRSRTAAINPRDIPSVESLQDSDAESDKTGKKSSASTSRLHKALKTTSAYQGFTKRRKGKVRAFDSGSQISSMTPSGSPVSELTSLPSGSGDFVDHEELDTFSIPGTVSEDSERSPRHFDAKQKTADGRKSGDSRFRLPSESEENAADTARRSRSQISSSSRSSKCYSRRSVPPKINEEKADIDGTDILSELKIQRKK